MLRLFGGIITLLLLGVINAAEVKFPESKPIISMTFPDDWQLTKTAEMQKATSATGARNFFIFTIDGEDHQQWRELALKKVTTIADFTERRVAFPENVEINGLVMRGVSEGIGKFENKPCNIDIMFLTIKDNQQIIVLLSTNSGGNSDYQVLANILDSLKLVK